jgi:hypothetical protein
MSQMIAEAGVRRKSYEDSADTSSVRPITVFIAVPPAVVFA